MSNSSLPNIKKNLNSNALAYNYSLPHVIPSIKIEAPSPPIKPKITDNKEQAMKSVYFVCPEELHDIIKMNVTDILKEYVTDITDIVNSNLLKIQLSTCKEFLNKEIRLETLEDNIINLSKQYQQLKEENERLKIQLRDALTKQK